MGNTEFSEKTTTSLATIDTNIKWILKIGGLICLFAIASAGTLYMRTENNALSISTVQAAMVQHYEEVVHEPVK